LFVSHIATVVVKYMKIGENSLNSEDVMVASIMFLVIILPPRDGEQMCD